MLAADQDGAVHGVNIYYPIYCNRQFLQLLTKDSKDVEGLSRRYILNLYNNESLLNEDIKQASLLPSIPLATITTTMDNLRVNSGLLPTDLADQKTTHNCAPSK